MSNSQPNAEVETTATPGRKPRTITRAELPLSCPLPDDSLWNAHPRVYLPIEQTGHAVCPYCGAEYVLEGS